MKYINVKGARQHNLKNIDISIPRDKLTVITGLSGSGKSSLAFDTLYAEGQRRYVESLSAYARQFLSVMDKPDVDTVEVLKSYSLDKGVDDSKWNLMTGEKKQIYDLARKSFLVAKKIHNEQTHGMIHTENFVLVDKDKRIRGYYDGTNIEEMDRLLDDIKILLDSYEKS